MGNKDFEDVTFYQWMIENWTMEGGLIPQATAGKLIGVTKGRITQMIKEGKLKEFRYENNVFVSYAKTMMYAKAKQYKIMKEETEKEIKELRKSGLLDKENIDKFENIINETYEEFEKISETIEIDF